ncbi:MAG TPA: hypothetical protein VGG25_31200 [Streptosporangiaceae bacterium]
MTVLVRHDQGCKWGRFAGTTDKHANILEGQIAAGHSDAAKRFADTFNLHRAAGSSQGWIAVRYADGSGGRDVFDSRAAAVAGCWPWEDRFFYCTLAAPLMSVCAAESLLRYRRIMAEMERPDRDRPHGGPEVIPRLAAEDQEAQIRAVRTGKGMIAMGHRKVR